MIVPPLDLDIPQNNTVDGGPIVYVNETSTPENTTIPERIGQLIFENADGWILSGVTVLGGVLIHRSRNIWIDSSDISGYQDGILVDNSGKISIRGSIIHGAVNGTRIVWSPDCEFSFNTIYGCQDGLTIDHSGDFSILGNNLTDCTITMDYSFLSDLSELGIPAMDENNTINGLPIFYRYNVNMMNAKIRVIDRSLIIFIKVVNVNIHDYQSIRSGCAVILLGCSYISFGNCSMVNETQTAVNVQFCDHVYIRDSIFFGNNDAIFFHNDFVCYVEKCSFVNNTGRGVYIERADTTHYRFLNNTFIGNDMGIVQNYRVKDIVIQGNLFVDNKLSFDAGYACSNLIWNNSFISGPRTKNLILVSYSTNWDYRGYGNYYSSYHGIDSDLDWIGDSPYELSSVSQNEDRFPLMYSPHVPPPELNVYDGKNNITLTWTAPEVMDVFEITGYQIIRESFLDRKIIDSVPAENLSYVDRSQQESDPYWYHVRAVVKYVNGNSSINGTASNRTMGILDNESPIIEIISPQEDSMLKLRTVKIEWNVEERLSPMKEILYMIDYGEFHSLDISKREVFFYDVEDGPHTVVVRAVDWHDNYAEDSVSFTVDATGPNITLISPKDNSYISSRDIRIKWTAVDELNDVIYYEMRLDYDVVAMGENARVYDAEDLDPGDHYIFITAWDGLNNPASIRSEFTIDLTPPELFIKNPYDGMFINTTSITIQWDVYDFTDSEVICLLSVNESEWVDVSDVREYGLENLNEGSHTIYMRAEDGAGNSISAEATFVVDLTDPWFEIISPDDGSRFNDGNVTFHLEGGDLISGVDELKYRIDGGRSWHTAFREELMIPDLTPGTHRIEIWVYDRARNHAYGERYIVIDVEKPGVLNIWPTSGIGPGDPIYIEFSEEMRTDTVEINIFGSLLDIEWSGKVARTRIKDGFLYNFAYEIRILRGKDLAGNDIKKRILYVETVDWAWIHGKVVDEKGLALEGIAVILDRDLYCFTDRYGYYLINTTSGAHNIRFSHPAFVENTTSVEVGPGEHLVLDTITLYEVEQQDTNEFKINPIIPIMVSLILLVLIAVEGYILLKKRGKKSYFEE
ncbi:MAG: NosD domain-containing protein [Thermoplasmatota archaeon]